VLKSKTNKKAAWSRQQTRPEVLPIACLPEFAPVKVGKTSVFAADEIWICRFTVMNICFFKADYLMSKVHSDGWWDAQWRRDSRLNENWRVETEVLRETCPTVTLFTTCLLSDPKINCKVSTGRGRSKTKKRARKKKEEGNLRHLDNTKIAVSAVTRNIMPGER
jgi:hypothetical protein